MAFFGVTIEEIDSVEPIEGADRIQKASLKDVDFDFVVKKDQFSEGDKCVYFPIDSVLPDWVIEYLGLTGKLSGNQRNRVKTVKLRSQVSQGIVAELDLINRALEKVSNPDDEDYKGTDLMKKYQNFDIDDPTYFEDDPDGLTEFLQVEKYEPPVVPCQTGNLSRLPCGLTKYDIEGAERNKDVVEYLMDKVVEVTEKAEGQNYSIAYDAQEDKIYVNQRKHSIEEKEGKEHDFWRVSRRDNLIELIVEVAQQYPNENVAVYGEFMGPGVQGNIYELEDHEVRIFDIKVGNRYLNPADRLAVSDIVRQLHVPVLLNASEGVTLREWLDGRTVTEASNGKSKMHPDTLREGIVIRPKEEEEINRFGRLIIKKRDPIYLSQNEN